MGLGNILCRRIIPALVLAFAILIGWIRSYPLSMGYVFATVMPILNGRLPPTIVGHGRMEGTPPVPDDLMPKARPAKEIFRDLPGGYKMPASGLGMCCRYSAYDDVLVRRTVTWYLLLGGRHIDGAHLYLNHKAIGLGIKDAIARGIPREEIFVTTKIFPSFYGYNTTLETVPTYLDELGLDYIDMVLMHAPGFPLVANECTRPGLTPKQCRQGTWKALSELRERGIMRNIGVSNFAVDKIKEVEELKLAPVADNQFQYNVFSPPSIQETFDYCLVNNITITAYWSLGSSLEHAKVQTVETLKGLSTKYDRSIAQIMLRWTLQKGAVVIPGTGNPKHMEENLSVYEFEITDQDMAKIDQLRYDEATKGFTYFDLDAMSK